MQFKYKMIPSSKSSNLSFYFVFQNDNLLIQLSDDIIKIPCLSELSELNLNFKPLRKLHFGLLNNHSCYTVEISADVTVSEGFSFRTIRNLYGLIEEEFLWIAGRAFQILDWDRKSQFCSRCGAPTEIKANEKAKICLKCNSLMFPRISPAIIVGVIKENQILLANNIRFPSDYYSVIAGFVEPGENLEQCVKREIKEEIGIDVTNIRYFGSQSWPFPDSLMIAFFADYSEGVITVDGKEIQHADWFSPNNLPRIPSKMSVSRKIIDYFVTTYQKT